ncbi:MAG: hypothetical protein M3211_02580 [Actinomycetota bacterium]|nr:hypothetical protein [Actinomycetota bacterium]
MTRPRRVHGPSPGHRALTRYGTAVMACLTLALLGPLALGPSAAAADLSSSAGVVLAGAPVADPQGADDKCHPWENWCDDDNDKCHPWWKCDNDKCHPWWKCDDDNDKCRPWWKCDDDRSTAPRSRPPLTR